jgi:hypothetical protein
MCHGVKAPIRTYDSELPGTLSSRAARRCSFRFKGNYHRNDPLVQLTTGAHVMTPLSLGSADGPGGPMLACWPTEKMLGIVSDRLADRVTAVCVLEWGQEPYQRAWIAAHNGVDLRNGQTGRHDRATVPGSGCRDGEPQPRGGPQQRAG